MIKMNEEKIKQFELSLKCANEMLEIQGRDGNYNYDSYMLGMYNGMEYIISLFEHREPNYRNGKEIEFLNDKQLQNNWNELKKWCKENQYDDNFDSYQVDTYTTYGVILKKMEEMEQGIDD